ncbi:MAG: NAD kinase [Draconibacterium sp.]|nr:MAG: NAD kinase [Draconibacterium sp.]
MKVAVFGTSVSGDFSPMLREFFGILEKKGIDVQLFEPFYLYLKEELGLDVYYTGFFHSYADIDPNNAFIFSIGGDGTFLHSVVNIRNFNIPVVGVNSGRLGFLADIAEDQVQTALNHIFNHQYSIVERSLLKVDFTGHKNLDFNFALNELAVVKTDTSSMINISAYLDNELLNNYWADGLIIATPTGSTAYSLSVGGPILTPDAENFIITPLAPHNLTVRPMVVPNDSEIILKVEGRGAQYLVSLDFQSVAVDFNTTIKIQKADFKLKTLQLPGQTFFNTIRNKLMWGLDRRN